MKPRNFIPYLVFLAGMLMATSAFSEDDDKAEKIKGKSDTKLEQMELKMWETETQHRLRVMIGPEFLFVTNAERKLMGVVFCAEAMYAAYQKMGVGFSLRQAFSGTAAIFFGLDLRFSFALLGTLPMTDRQAYLGETLVYDRQSFHNGAFVLQLIATQLFFSNASISLPFSGVGVSIGYELSSSSKSNIKIGARVDKLSNGPTSLMPMQGFLSVGFSL